MQAHVQHSRQCYHAQKLVTHHFENVPSLCIIRTPYPHVRPQLVRKPCCSILVLPVLEEPPDKLSVTQDSITLRWSLWREFVDDNLELIFKVNYRDSASGPDDWLEYPEQISQNRQATYNKAVVTTLDTSTHYYFRIVPFIIDGDETYEGGASPESLSVKTDCSSKLYQRRSVSFIFYQFRSFCREIGHL